MEPDKKPEPTEDEPAKNEQDAPADALSRTPEDLEEEQAKQAADSMDAAVEEPEKKLSPIKKIFRKVNLYFLIFLLLVVGAAVFMIVNYLNSQKAVDPVSNIATQGLSEKALKQLSNTDATVGSASQTLTIQGNAIISGQTLMRGDLDVAGNFQSGGSIQGPNLTISGEANLGDAQINNLQVATDAAVQGNTTLQDLSVAGTAAFSGALAASEVTVTKLILSGNSILQVPNHISFAGPSPNHNINPAALGRGGSASVNGSDTAGTVNVNTGSGTTPGCFVQINFHQQFSNQPHVIISPVGVAAGKTQYYVTRTNGNFSICAASAAPANQAFAFDYFVTN